MRSFGAYPALTLRADPIQAVITDLFPGFRRLRSLLAELLFQSVNAEQPELKRNCNHFQTVTLLHKPHSSLFTVSRLLNALDGGFVFRDLFERVCR